MFSEMAEHVQVGLSALLLAVFLLLLSFRLTRKHLDVRDKIRYPMLILLVLGLFYDAFFLMDKPLPPLVARYFFAVLYLALAVLVVRLFVFLFFRFLGARKQYRVPKLLEEITKFVLYAVAVTWIVQDTLNIRLATVLATSAIITVVLGLALQETLGNLFAGLALHMDPAYQVGDWIQAGDNVGRVEEITWRATKLRTTDNDFIVIPNGNIAKERLTNRSSPRIFHSARLHIGLSYAAPPNRVDQVVRSVLAQTDNVVMDPPPEVRVNAYQDFSIDYDIKFYYKDFGLIEQTLAAIRKGIWYHFKRSGLQIPFPIRNLYLHEREEEEANARRVLQRLTDSLQKVDVFSMLEAEERLLIAEHLQELFFAAGETIIREGETGDSFFIIDEGEVEVSVGASDGGRKVLSRLREGDFFGEIALLTGERRTATVVAVEDVRVHELKKEGFREVLESKPRILDEISNVLSRRKDELLGISAETSEADQAASMSTMEIKGHILGRIRRYFGV